MPKRSTICLNCARVASLFIATVWLFSAGHHRCCSCVADRRAQPPRHSDHDVEGLNFTALARRHFEAVHRDVLDDPDTARAARQLVLDTGTPSVQERVDTLRRKCSTGDEDWPLFCAQMGWPWVSGPWEPGWLHKRLLEKRIGPLDGTILVDIGANTGRDTEEYRTRGPSLLLLFEPLHSNVETLHEKFDQYSHVHVFPYGLGAHPRNVAFQLGDTMNQGATEVKPNLPTDVKAGVPTAEQSRVEDIIPILRKWVPRDHKVFLTINCEGCEFEVLARLATYDGGAYLKNGTIRQMNVAIHLGKQHMGTRGLKDYCVALPLVLKHFRQTYCAGPWVGWISHDMYHDMQDGLHRSDCFACWPALVGLGFAICDIISMCKRTRISG